MVLLLLLVMETRRSSDMVAELSHVMCAEQSGSRRDYHFKSVSSRWIFGLKDPLAACA